MALIRKTFTRSTEPDQEAMRAALTPLLAVSNAGGFLLDYDAQKQLELIDYGDWTGVDLAAVQTQVTNCAARSSRTDAKLQFDNIQILQKGIYLTILDEINILRVAASLPPKTINQFFNAVKNKIDTL